MGLAFLLEVTNLELTLELFGLRRRRHRVLEPRIFGPAVIVTTKHQHITGERRSGKVDQPVHFTFHQTLTPEECKNKYFSTFGLSCMFQSISSHQSKGLGTGPSSHFSFRPKSSPGITTFLLVCACISFLGLL